MARTAQLSSTHQNNGASFMTLTSKLARLGVQTTHPISDGFIFTQNAGAPGPVSALWTPYESNLDYYESITGSDIFVVNNPNGLVTEEMARGMLFAMLKQKPILLVKAPVFCAHVGAFMRHTITKRLDQYTVVDLLQEGESETMQRRLDSMPAVVDYKLRQRDKAIIEATIRHHFRNLLDKNKKTAVEQRSLAASVA